MALTNVFYHNLIMYDIKLSDAEKTDRTRNTSVFTSRSTDASLITKFPMTKPSGNTLIRFKRNKADFVKFSPVRISMNKPSNY